MKYHTGTLSLDHRLMLLPCEEHQQLEYCYQEARLTRQALKDYIKNRIQDHEIATPIINQRYL